MGENLRNLGAIQRRRGSPAKARAKKARIDARAVIARRRRQTNQRKRAESRALNIKRRPTPSRIYTARTPGGWSAARIIGRKPKRNFRAGATALPERQKTHAQIMSKLKAKAPELIKPGKIKAVLFGPSGVGKTTLALSFPEPYYYDVEGGAKGPQYRQLLKDSGGAYMGPEDGTLLGETLIEQMQALATERHPYKTLVIDSVTKLFQTMIANEAERLGSKDAFGASKKPAVAMMRRIVMWASRLDMNIWFICHDAAEWGMIDGQRTEIGRVPDVWDKLVYELDLCIHATRRGPAREATVKKTRLVGFPDGASFKLDFAEFAARQGRDAIGGESVPVVMATPAQIEEVEKLLSIVKDGEELRSKWFDKADVEGFAEMTGEQIAKCADLLRKKLSGEPGK